MAIFFGFNLSPFRLSVARTGLRHLDQLNLIALRGIDKSDASSIGLKMGSIGVFEPESLQMLAELLQAFYLEREMGKVRLDFDRAAYTHRHLAAWIAHGTKRPTQSAAGAATR